MLKPTLLRICLLASSALLSIQSFATHNVAGEIVYEFTSINTIRATIITYTKESSVQADRDSLPIHWGDGSADDIVVRSNGPNGNGQSLGNDIKKNIYVGTHTYQSPPSAPNNFYIVSLTDPNRNSDISNISNSVNVQFYVEDTVWFKGQGSNHSPLLLYPPIDYAFVGDTFFHNPTAYDIEADSLTFDLMTPLQFQGSVVPGYYDPATIPYVSGDTMVIDHSTGMITWSVPQVTGVYNIAILIHEYRYGILLGTVERDMQIRVRADSIRHAPLNGAFVPTTIISGQNFNMVSNCVDANPSHLNRLSAYGGPFTLASDAATFSSTPGNQPFGLMTWTPPHNQYKNRETHVITTRAQVNDSSGHITLRSFLLTVVDSTVIDSTHTAISELSDSHIIVRIYPNPVADVLTISVDEEIHSLAIYTVMGQLVYKKDGIRQSSFSLPVSDLSDGSYILAVKDREGASTTTRFQLLR